MSDSGCRPRNTGARPSTTTAVCWLTLDKADAAANTLSSEVLEELARELDVLRTLTLRGLVFESGKRSGFILGADVNEFCASAAMRRMPPRWPRAAKRCSGASRRSGCRRLPPSTASRSAAEWSSRSPATIESPSSRTSGRSGLPEVQLGIHPGFGGSVRAVEILGPPLALDLMLTGRSLSPHEALKCGPRRSSRRARGAAAHGEGARRSPPSSAARTVVLGGC